MSAHEVQSAIIRGFQHLQVARITFLTCCDGKSNMLRPDGDQDQDGSALIDASQSRKGVTYVTDSEVSVCTITLSVYRGTFMV